MADVRIPDLPAASAVADTDILIIDNGITTQRATAAMIRDPVREQVQSGSLVWCGEAGGTSSALTLTPSPAITAYVAGQEFQFTAGVSNTGAATVSVSGLAAVAIQNAGAALVSGDIVAGRAYSILYTGSAFQIAAHSLVVPVHVATESVSGISRQATIAEAESGVSTTPDALPHVTPEGVAAALVPVKESITAVEARTTSIESSRGRSATVDLQGMTSYTFGSIPSSARNIRLITTHCNSTVTSAKPFVKIRTSSGLITSNYVGSVVQHGNTNSCLVSSSIVQIELAYNSTNLDFNHCLELRRFPNYGWQWTGVGGFRTNYTTTCGGDIEYNENIIGLTLSLSSGAWATGGAFLEWEK